MKKLTAFHVSTLNTVRLHVFSIRAPTKFLLLIILSNFSITVSSLTHKKTLNNPHHIILGQKVMASRFLFCSTNSQKHRYLIYYNL